jgi:ribosomal protein S18 acetylase RimI-like enzyme
LIRKYNQIDRPELIEIFKLNTPHYFNPNEVKDFEEYLVQNGDTYLTIEIDHKIAGGTGYQITDNNTIGRITWIFFHPDFSGLGLGRQSVEYCLNIFKANPSIKKLVVTTSQLAYKFFEKFGYKLTSTEKDYWGKGLDLYTMEINLQA